MVTISKTTQLEVRPLVAAEGMLNHALQRHYAIVPRSRFIDVKTAGGVVLERIAPSARTAPRPVPTELPVFDPYAPTAPAVSDLAVSLDAAGAAAGASSSMLRDLAEQLVQSNSADDVAEAVVSFVMQDFARALLLVAKGDQLVGGRTYGEGANRNAAKLISIPLSAGSPFAQCLVDGLPRIGPGGEPFRPLMLALGDPGPYPTIILPLRHQARAVGCLVAIAGRDDVLARKDEYATVARKAGLAFQLAQLRRQILE
jgi:hypothetical protein